MINKNIINSNGTVDKIIAVSLNDYDISIGSEYKLIKIAKKGKSFKDTFLGADIGVHSKGFINVAIISMLIAICLVIFMYLSFRV